MKDMLGNEIEVGDEVVYASDRGDPTLTVGVVIEVSETSAKIDRLHSGNNYRSVRGGMITTRRWDKDANGWVHKTSKARTTTIAFPIRCIIVKKKEAQ